MTALRCQVPYAQEGLIRRELEGTGASLQGVVHGALVEFVFSLPEAAAAALVARLNEACHGRIGWLE